MTGPAGNSGLWFPETLNVLRGKDKGKIEVEGKQNSLLPAGPVIKCFVLLYRQECFTGKYTTRKIHTKPHPGLKWRIFHILTSEDIVFDDVADIKFVS